MRCTRCAKLVPAGTHYCAYCGQELVPPPAPMPRVQLEPRMAARAAAAGLCGASLGGLYWLLPGALAATSVEPAMALGAVAGAAGAGLGALWSELIAWPLAGRRARPADVRRLGFLYGAGGGLSLAAGGALIGSLVLLLSWGLAAPSLRVLLVGMLAGTITLLLSLPAAAVLGALLGWLLGGVGARIGGTAGAGAGAGLAWLLAASSGGALLGARIAASTGLAIGLGALAGGLAQTVLAAFLLLAGTHVLRQVYILRRRLP
jgi:hypothetical protein